MVMSDLTNKRKEKISAFLDDDMHPDELMSFSLSADPEDAKLAQRYQLMGDALRGEMSDSSFIDVSQAVREVLADESLAVDNASKPVTTAIDNKASLFDLSAWFKPVAGMAVAASVAVVMVVTLSAQETGTSIPVAKNIEQQPAIQVATENKLIDKKVIDEKATELDPHLVNQHLEFATQDTLQGRLPYVRAVSYETENKPIK